MASVSYCLILRIAFVKVIVVRKPLKIIKKRAVFWIQKPTIFFLTFPDIFPWIFMAFLGPQLVLGPPLGPPWVPPGSSVRRTKFSQRRIVRELRLQRLELTKFHLWWPGTKPIVKPWSFMGQHGTTQPEMRRSNIYDRLTLFCWTTSLIFTEKGELVGLHLEKNIEIGNLQLL